MCDILALSEAGVRTMKAPVRIWIAGLRTQLLSFTTLGGLWAHMMHFLLRKQMAIEI